MVINGMKWLINWRQVNIMSKIYLPKLPEDEIYISADKVKTELLKDDFCKQYVLVHEEYINTNQFFKHRDGYYYIKYTKDEINQMIDVYNPLTFLPFLEELDFPYIKYEWQKLVKDYIEKKGFNFRVFGRYLAKMKLTSFKNFTYKDSDWINSQKFYQ